MNRRGRETQPERAGGAEAWRKIPEAPGLCPEQVSSFLGSDDDVLKGEDSESDGAGEAVLLDQWGRAHPLRPVSTIGREPGRATVAVLEASVSREHAELRRDGHKVWTVVDRGSTNGTFVDGQRVQGSAPLGDGSVLAVGNVGFLFLTSRRSNLARRLTESIRATAGRARATIPAPDLRLIAAANGGAGLVEYGATSLRLGSTQFALLALLAERATAEAARPEAVRGFVRSIELIASLPWDTAHPDDNHVKQMVRRVRRALERLGVAQSIESRHGFGYRLCVPVRGDSTPL
jgi:pSer/pThr/pTyr-binding forkhead associated (FHA) protein